MNNVFDELTQALSTAADVKRIVANHANKMVDLLEGNLEHVSHYRLVRLKAALRRFDAHKKEWKP